ncbi:hypothetical protein ACHAXA_004704 [Cyclostephanos tholiformis]|uniref:Uncharacterized protein n=1 Tax=Cyclostephanos tholiformis TaxID=382380 RepID=A0ABD3SRI6_9STRA
MGNRKSVVSTAVFGDQGVGGGRAGGRGVDDDEVDHRNALPPPPDCSAFLSLIEEDDFWLDNIRIGNGSPQYTEEGQVDMSLPRDRASMKRLGRAIAGSRNLRGLCLDCLDELTSPSAVDGEGNETDDDDDDGNNNDDFLPSMIERRNLLLGGIRRNRSIRTPVIWGNDRPFGEGGIGHEILDAFQSNASNYDRFEMWRCPTEEEDVAAMEKIASFLVACRNLVEVKITSCRIGRDQLSTLLHGHAAGGGCGGLSRGLTKLDFDCNDVGIGGGCEVIANVLRDPSCALRVLSLRRNGIDDSGATMLADSLSNNDTLEELHLDDNPGISSGGIQAFSRLLCDASTINSTYHSNHTLRDLGMSSFPREVYRTLASNLLLNSSSPPPSIGGGCNGRSSDVGMRKILRNHTRLDVMSLLEWDIKLLPHVVIWFDKAKRVLSRHNDHGDPNHSDIVTMKWGAIFEFVRAMPTTWHASIFN